MGPKMPRLSLLDILTLLPDAVVRQRSQQSAECDHITLDSRRTTSNSIFVALCGQHLDARRFIESSFASVILVDAWSEDWSRRAAAWNKTIIQVDDARCSMALLASVLADNPAKKMTMIGITGTNGKTTTTWMLSHILMECAKQNSSSLSVGTIGTIGPHLNGQPLPNSDGFTTPESPALQRMLKQFVEAKCEVCIMEVSSIGLMMQRVGGVQFDVAAFTNFTQDHLDIHESMDAYLLEKQKLFTDHVHKDSTSILVVDQPEIANTPVSQGKAISLSTENRTGVDVWVSNHIFQIDGTRCTIHHPSGTQELYIPLIGQHNIENALVATSIANTQGYSLESIAKSFSSLPQAPGRMERISSPEGWHAFVDYAHTPDALGQAISALQPLCKGRLWVLFGCGGDRDTSKRPQMGSIAATSADNVIVTSDNPRTEPPQGIIDDILEGIPVECQSKITVIVDRREAIRHTAVLLRHGDVLLIAGKGHETYQIVGTTKHHFDDREEIQQYC